MDIFRRRRAAPVAVLFTRCFPSCAVRRRHHPPRAPRIPLLETQKAVAPLAGDRVALRLGANQWNVRETITKCAT